MTVETIGRFELSVELNSKGNLGTLSTYDVVLSKDDTVIQICTRCVGDASVVYWKQFLSTKANRLNILYDDLSRANHNLQCYSTNYLMCTAKDGYEEKWCKEQSKIIVLTQWIKEIES